MHICLYTDTALPKMGGQEMVVDALARAFLAAGQSVTVLAPRPKPRYRTADASLPYRVLRHPRFYSSRYFVDWYGQYLVKCHRQHPFDILHCHGIYPIAYLAARMKAEHRAPVVITSHGGDVRDGNIRLTKPVVAERYRVALQGADALVAISNATHEGYLRLGAELPKIISIPNGVDLGHFATPVQRPPNLDVAIHAGEYVLFLGRLKHCKGVDVLLHALRCVPSQGHVELVIAGDGSERSRLESLACSLQVMHRVRFVGAVHGDIKTYLLQNARCGIMPSRSEGFPLVLLECYAAGLAIIATDIPGVRDHVTSGSTGWLVAPESAEELGRALTQVFTQRETTKQMGAQARQKAQQYSWQSIAAEHLSLYRRLLKENAPRLAG